MRRLSYDIPVEFEGRKVVHFLRTVAGCSAGLVKALKQTDNGILCNGVHARTIDLLRQGDKLEITIHDAAKTANLSNRQVQVLYEDEDIMVFNKPADMPCHQSKQHQQDTLANVFAAICNARGETRTYRSVNRLDRNTTGAVVVAKNAFAAAALAGKIEKVYLAVVGGKLADMHGSIDAPIGRPDPYDIRRAVRVDGQHAVTLYTVMHVQEDRAYSVVACRLPTGRTHQIRVHMAHLGCPLLGDDLYGGRCDEMKRQALHCMQVEFKHPVSGTQVQVSAPLAQDLRALIPQSILPSP